MGIRRNPSESVWHLQVQGLRELEEFGRMQGAAELIPRSEFFFGTIEVPTYGGVHGGTPAGWFTMEHPPQQNG